MGFLSDLFFGTGSTSGSHKPSGSRKFGSDYDDYYDELHSDAFSGDADAREEMEDEFGDGWEDEF